MPCTLQLSAAVALFAAFNSVAVAADPAPTTEARAEKPLAPSERLDLREQERILQERAGTDRPAADSEAGAEKFVPGSPRYLAGASLQLRPEATVVGEEVRLRQICRWSNADKAAFEPVADLVLMRLPAGSSFRSFTFAELKQTLSDAGVNLGIIRFCGSSTCAIKRADAVRDERTPLDQWIDARKGSDGPAARAATPPATTAPAVARLNTAAPATTPAEPAANVAAKAADKPPLVADAAPEHSLRELIAADLSERLALKPDALQLRFDPQDEKVLNLREPLFHFNLTPRRVFNLGQVSWDVTLVADGVAGKTATQKLVIEATAKAWQEQVVAAKPMAWRQVVRDEDLIDRRTLIDRLSDDPVVTRSQIVGQMAGRDVRAGTIFTSRLVEAVPLIRPGQLVTVTVDQGGIRVKSAARAVEGGSFGQTIKVRNEVTKDTYEVVCTGPQEAQLGPAAPPDASAVRGKIASLDKD